MSRRGGGRVKGGRRCRLLQRCDCEDARLQGKAKRDFGALDFGFELPGTIPYGVVGSRQIRNFWGGQQQNAPARPQALRRVPCPAGSGLRLLARARARFQ